MRNARAKGKRIGRPPRTFLDQDARRSVYEAHASGGESLRQLAVRFGTSIGTVQRCIQLYQGLHIAVAIRLNSKAILIPS